MTIGDGYGALRFAVVRKHRHRSRSSDPELIQTGDYKRTLVAVVDRRDDEMATLGPRGVQREKQFRAVVRLEI